MSAIVNAGGTASMTISDLITMREYAIERNYGRLQDFIELLMEDHATKVATVAARVARTEGHEDAPEDQNPYADRTHLRLVQDAG